MCSVCGQAGHNRRSCGKVPGGGSRLRPVPGSSPVGESRRADGGSARAVSDVEVAWERVGGSFTASDAGGEEGEESLSVDDLETWWMLSGDGKRGKQKSYGEQWWKEEDTKKLFTTIGMLPDNEETSTTVKRFLKKFGADAKYGLASYDGTPEHIVAVLAEDVSVTTRAAVAAREDNLPVRVMWALARDRHDKVREALSGNPTVPAEILSHLYEHRFEMLGKAKNRPEYVEGNIAENPNCPPELVQSFLADRRAYVLARVMVNPQVSDDGFAHILLSHPGSYSIVHRAVRSTRITSALASESLERIMESREQRVRLGRKKIMKSWAEEYSVTELLDVSRSGSLVSGEAIERTYRLCCQRVVADSSDVSQVLVLISKHPNTPQAVLKDLVRLVRNPSFSRKLNPVTAKIVIVNVRKSLAKR